MRRISTFIAILALACCSIGPFGHTTAAQTVVIPLVPAAAVIRGENIRLRVDPAEVTEIVAILQRGDAITITGEPVAADGDEFYPVEAVATGDAGWVRDLFIDPRSIVPIDAPAEAEPAPEIEIDVPEQPTRRERAAEEDTAEADGAPESEDETQNQRNRRNRADRNAAEDAQPEEDVQPELAGEAIASVSGAGTAVSETFLLEPGRYRATVTMQVDEFSGFIADLHGPDEFLENLFNELIEEPQAWTAETVVRIQNPGEYFIEVSNTELEWTIEFAPA